MHAKTMEGLIGARTNINMTNVPMRVFKEARRKGDLGTMERAMGYVNEYEEKAYDYKDKAAEGMREEAQEAREKEKLERQQAIEKRREERKEQAAQTEARMQENRDQMQISTEINDPGSVTNPTVAGTKDNTGKTATDTTATATTPSDTVEISAEGQMLAQELNPSDHLKPSGIQPDKPILYSSAGVEKRGTQSEPPKLNISV